LFTLISGDGRKDAPIFQKDFQKEKSRLAAGPSCFASFNSELATALALLIGPLALTVRILLLLSGLLAAALLARFLTRVLVLLTRVLVLLARILILVRHRDLPC
jgi:hypothetical protein